MPIIMGLEGRRQATPWAQIQSEALSMMPRPFWRASARLEGVLSAATKEGDPCCWRCPCESNVCCDSASPMSRAYASVRRTMASSASGRALKGITDGFRWHPVLTFAGIFAGMWLAGTASGQRVVKKIRRK